MSLTAEQQAVLNHIQSGQADGTIVQIDAKAGSGKTHLLTSIANAIPHTNSLYICYNKSIAVEASRKFPATTACSTTHSVAYRAVVKPYNLRVGTFSYKQINDGIPYETKLVIIELIREFCLSSYLSFDQFATDNRIPQALVTYCLKYLNLMESGKIECTHDFYLKVFHIGLSTQAVTYEPFDFILLDECVVGRTGIRTDAGVFSITNLYNKQQKGETLPLAKSFNHTTQQFEYKPIVKVHFNGVKQTYNVATTSKVTLKATAKHKVLTQSGYKHVEDLIPYKDYILSDNQNNLRISKLLNSDQYQIILGSYLGDGSLIQEKPNVNCYSMKFTQGEAQLDYLKWKMTAFPELSTRLVKSGYTGLSTIHQSSQVPNFILPNDPFTEVLTSINPLGLAVWAMDDGCIAANRLTLCSNSFTYEQNVQLSDMLATRFQIQSKVQSNGKGHWGIVLSSTATRSFIDLVAPYLHPVFTTKWVIPEQPTYNLNPNYLSYGASYVESVTPYKETKVYDLSVLDNNNYITTSTAGTDQSAGLLVHNCGDLNEVTLEIFRLLPARFKIAVGDRHQNIYTFNHTINAFDLLASEGTLFHMTKSFRVATSIASSIESFCRKHLDPEMSFIGTDTSDQTITTRAYLTRTNSALVGKMIELDEAGTPYSLVRKATEIFKLPLLVINFKHQGTISDPLYSHLQVDIDQWYEEVRYQPEAPGLYGYLLSLYENDVPLVNALKLVIRYGKDKVKSAYAHSRTHENTKCNLTLLTVHSSKGLEFDEVTISDDMNEVIDQIITNSALTGNPYSADELAELRLYYVACSRAKLQLNNANLLYR